MCDCKLECFNRAQPIPIPSTVKDHGFFIDQNLIFQQDVKQRSP